MSVDQAAVAANRFGLGARPGELDAIEGKAGDWLAAQLGPSVLPEGLGPAPARGADVARSLGEMLAARREARRAGRAGAVSERGTAGKDPAKALRRLMAEDYRAQVAYRYRLATTTEQPFRERLVRFWSNHFAVSADKFPLAALAGDFENEAIRPRVMGRFVDLLRAAVRHPAMILYLDNERSMGPDSRLARVLALRGRTSGLNENLGREVLELHTVGVDAGYTQADVTTFAKVLTGWSLARSDGSDGIGRFRFRPAMHEPGPKTVLGKRYRAAGEAEGDAVLEDLARHPATARHIATKLARHFVADAPPARVVEGLAAEFMAADGRLDRVYEALIGAREAWQLPFAKYKTPDDLVVSVYRALGAAPARPERPLALVQGLGQQPYTPGSPAGWPDTAGDWAGSEAVLARVDFAALAGRAAAGRHADAVRVARSALGGHLGVETLAAIRGAADAPQALALLFASPEFQRR